MRVNCSACGQVLQVKDEMAGKRGKCPHCKQFMTVPDNPTRGEVSGSPGPDGAGSGQVEAKRRTGTVVRTPRQLAEDERERIVKRAKDDRKVAKKSGIKFGRKPKLNATEQRRARDLMRQGGSIRAVADEMNVHYSTISRLR